MSPELFFSEADLWNVGWNIKRYKQSNLSSFNSCCVLIVLSLFYCAYFKINAFFAYILICNLDYTLKKAQYLTCLSDVHISHKMFNFSCKVGVFF